MLAMETCQFGSQLSYVPTINSDSRITLKKQTSQVPIDVLVVYSEFMDSLL